MGPDFGCRLGRDYCGLFKIGAAPRTVARYTPGIGTGVPMDRIVKSHRCDDGPVRNFSHGAYYGGPPPAVFRDHACPPFYRHPPGG